MAHKLLSCVLFCIISFLFCNSTFALGASSGVITTSHKVYVPIIEGRWGFVDGGNGRDFGHQFVDRTGGTSPTHFIVSNLNNTGSGSLRDALESTAAHRIITCTVSGRINITSDISVSVGNLILAGETCPAPGITISGPGGIAFEDGIAGSIVIRHISCEQGGAGNLNTSCFGSYAVPDVVMSHVSAFHMHDESISGWSSTNTQEAFNWYILDSITAEGIGAFGHGPYLDNGQYMVYRHLDSHNYGRVPYASSHSDILWLNTVSYDTAEGITLGNAGRPGNVRVDVVSSVYLENSGGTTYTVNFDIGANETADMYFNNNNQNNNDNPETGDDYDDHMGCGTPRCTESVSPHSIFNHYIPADEIITNLNASDPLWDSISQTVGAWPASRSVAVTRQITEIQNCLDNAGCVEYDGWCATECYDWVAAGYDTIPENTRGSGGVPTLTFPTGNDKWVLAGTGRMAIEQVVENCASMVNKTAANGGSQC